MLAAHIYFIFTEFTTKIFFMDAMIFRYGHMARLLSEICPGRTLAVLEGGYFKTNYVEAASMMVRGLKVRVRPTSKAYK